MKLIAIFLFGLLLSCTAISHPNRQVTAHGHVRVVHPLSQQNVRVAPRPAGHPRVAVVVPLARPAHRGVAVVTYRPHGHRVVYARHVHRHHGHCQH